LAHPKNYGAVILTEWRVFVPFGDRVETEIADWRFFAGPIRESAKFRSSPTHDGEHLTDDVLEPLLTAREWAHDSVGPHLR